MAKYLSKRKDKGIQWTGCEQRNTTDWKCTVGFTFSYSNR